VIKFVSDLQQVVGFLRVVLWFPPINETDCHDITESGVKHHNHNHSSFMFQLLEYNGRGKSIHDVGLAQARYPLDTTNHYFEIEIVDPGENCYIAIGVARRVSIVH
jgi:hypothetical protein